MSRKSELWIVALLVALTSLVMEGQTTPSSEPAAVSLVQIAAALAGTARDQTISAEAIAVSGSERLQGVAILKVRGTKDSYLELDMNDGIRTELRSTSTVVPTGRRVFSDGRQTPIALHNLWTPAGWFSPSSLLQTALERDVVLTYEGKELVNGESVEHVRFWRKTSDKDPTFQLLIERLSATDLYLDEKSHLLSFARFEVHPDDDYNRHMPAEVRFTDYRRSGAGLMPGHIQKLVNHSLVLDLSVSSVADNTDLSENALTSR